MDFRGDSHKVGDPNSRNFLGTLELLGKYDIILNKNLQNVRKKQTNKQKNKNKTRRLVNNAGSLSLCFQNDTPEYVVPMH